MEKKLKTWVLIPVFNEERTIGKVIKEILRKEKRMKVLVVDDGSTDRTAEIAAKAGAKVMRYFPNRGKGYAKQKGFEWLLSNAGEFNCLITMDGDGQHSPDDLEKFLSAARQGADIVIGNRMESHRNMPWLRYLTNRLMSFLNSLAIGKRLKDTQCDFRLIRKRVLEKISIFSAGFEADTEFLIKAAKEKFRIAQVSIKTIYFASRKSKIKAIQDTRKYLKLMIKGLLNHI